MRFISTLVSNLCNPEAELQWQQTVEQEQEKTVLYSGFWMFPGVNTLSQTV